MKEVIYNKKPIGELTESVCPACKSRLYHTTIPCPDQKEGCCVLHYGHKCENCGRIYQ